MSLEMTKKLTVLLFLFLILLTNCVAETPPLQYGFDVKIDPVPAKAGHFNATIKVIQASTEKVIYTEIIELESGQLARKFPLPGQSDIPGHQLAFTILVDGSNLSAQYTVQLLIKGSVVAHSSSKIAFSQPPKAK